MFTSLPEYFFVDSTGAQAGPASADELKAYFSGGVLSAQSYVYAADGSMENWTRQLYYR